MRLTLRIKLALISLLLLLIPLAGFRISDMIKKDLLTSREETLLFSARSVSSALSGQSGLFDRELFSTTSSGKDLYLYRLAGPIRLNGKIDDWALQLPEARSFGEENLLSSSGPYLPQSFHFRHLTGVRGDYLYALFLVTDDRLIYHKANSPRLDQSDHLQIGVEDRQGKMHQYLLTATEAGWVNGFLIPNNDSATFSARPEPRIQGMWSESAEGYILEIRLPMDMVGQKLAFAITDVDDPLERRKRYVIGTAMAGSEELGWLLTASDTISAILESLNRPHSRVLIVDYNRRVRASYGQLSEEESGKNTKQTVLAQVNTIIYSLFSPLYKLFTTPFASNFDHSPPQLATLDLKGVSEALEGKSTITRYNPVDSQVEIMAAITPLTSNGEVVGAVVVEQTTNSILALQNKVIEESITLTIIVFGLGGIGLLLFASRLSSRIRRLGQEAASAISTSGRITPTISNLDAGDEIGELSRTLNSMLKQLKIQTEFREKMADNLEHEMRTPLAGISASLKNLANELDNPPDHITGYLNWALEDVNRLESLLTEVRDATNLQDLISRDEKEEFELNNAMAMWLQHSWRPAFPEVEFIYDQPEEAVILFGDPARIHQMFDKLVENAVSFHTHNTPITMRIEQQAGQVLIAVSNQGPIIEEEFQGQIFNSMVSQRQQKDNKPHLGLGLYIVRTIVEHHRGTISVDSSEETGLTTFTVRLKTNTGG